MLKKKNKTKNDPKCILGFAMLTVMEVRNDDEASHIPPTGNFLHV